MDRSQFDLTFARLIKETESLIPIEFPPDLPCIPDVPGVPDWHDFEHKIWNNGEAIRQLIYTERKKLTRAQVSDILNICNNVNAKRGRESFVMLLGKKAYAEYAPQIAILLHDHYIEGHVVYTLYKMRTPGYTSEITPFLMHKRAWVRNYAKQYIQKYGD